MPPANCPSQNQSAGITQDCPKPDALQWARRFFPEGRLVDRTELNKLIAEAKKAASNELGVRDALQWAAGYVIPQRSIDSDVACLRAALLDFTAMVRRRLTNLAASRLNAQRVATLRVDNPERALLFDLVDGMRVFLPSEFIPNGKDIPSPLRESYLAVAPAVNRMLGDMIDTRLAFILPLALALQYVPRLHFCKAHWTPKKGKASGRPLGDLTYVDGTPLNTPETAKMATDYYGPINHPTIQDIACMVAQFVVLNQHQEPEVVLWKMDLKGAYTLLSYRPEDVGLFAMQLTNNLVYLQFVGIFGWAATPAAFQVVTRAIQFELVTALSGPSLMYVDDVIGVCLRSNLAADLATARNICTQLLGPQAVADDKTDSGRRLDVIGFTIDLDISRVLISRKNHLRALHGFLSVDLDGTLMLKDAQKYASWSSRYGMICRVMRPFCNALHRLGTGRKNPHARFSLTQEARVAIQCWQALLCLVPHDEVQFTRKLFSFIPHTATIVAEFDSSLSGVGVVWYKRPDGAEECVGVCAISVRELGFGEDSSFQNLAEFIGAIIAVIGFIRLGGRGNNLDLRGDSITALTWAVTERPRGHIVTNAAMVWTLLCIAAEVHIAEVDHIAGVDNKTCDQLSRRTLTSNTSIEQEATELGLGGARVLLSAEDPALMRLIKCCDPTRPLDTDAQFEAFWTETRTHVEDVLRQ